MEISAMIAQLKDEAVSIGQTLRVKETEANTLRDRIHQLDAEIQSMTDRYDALRMAIDSLELVTPQTGETHVAIPAPSAPTEKKAVARTHSRLPKKIGKFNPKGQKIGEFASINKAAKEFGWTNASMAKYIEKTGKEKQIRLRGYYLEFIAA